MEKFCGCNSEWVLDQPGEHKFRFQSTTYSRDGLHIGYCFTCGLYYWQEPHHENMMFDLRRMNQC